MPIGSPRPNAGRPKGARAKKTEEAVAAAEAGGITPLEYLLTIMRDKYAETGARIDCAKAAAPYVHARLSTVVADIKGDLNHTVRSIERTIVDPAHTDS